jgi:hypothetical protein
MTTSGEASTHSNRDIPLDNIPDKARLNTSACRNDRWFLLNNTKQPRTQNEAIAESRLPPKVTPAIIGSKPAMAVGTVHSGFVIACDVLVIGDTACISLWL